MPVYTLTPVTVDGYSLDALAHGVEKKTRTIPAAINADTRLPGMDGVAGSLNDDYEAGILTLGMWVKGTDVNGVVPPGSNSVAEVRRNVELLAFLFSKKHALIDIREDVAGLGIRQLWCKGSDPVTPEVVVGSVCRFTVTLIAPGVFSQDVEVSDWAQSSVVSDTVYEVANLQGSSAPVGDASILFTGPGNNPQITDVTTGGYIRLNQVLTAGQQWRVNSNTWTSRLGTGLGVGSLDTAGTNVESSTVYGGLPGKAPMLSLTPGYVDAALRVRVKVTGVGFTSATALAVRARRKFLL